MRTRLASKDCHDHSRISSAISKVFIHRVDQLAFRRIIPIILLFSALSLGV
jgi:hypothetical protein